MRLARSFAQELVRLRDELAPNVLLAYHMSGWGTRHDIVHEKPPDAVVERYAAQSAAFYRALHTKFDVAFEDFSDRDAGFSQMDNTWDHYQDNRVQWLLGAGSRARLRAYAAAGFAGFLFGRGADGATCACDAAGDGVTNPAPVDGNTARSVSADDDGGYFEQRAALYYRSGGLTLP